MALDFPAPPWTNGQTYANYVYNSATGAWLSKPLTGPKSTYGPTPPANPNPGDEWVNSNDMTAYGWYVDTDGGQWVEKTAPISANGYYSPNYIINGGFDIWQRGTSATIDAANTYKSADRWVAYKNNAGATESRQASGLTGIQYCGRYQRNSGNTTTDQLWAYQTIETVNSIPLAGKTVTLSFYARKGANYSASSSALLVQLRSGTGTDQNALSGFTGSATPINQNATLTTSWQRFSYTGTLDSSVTQLGVVFIGTPTGTAGAADYYEITGVQLEEGSVATTFRRNANSLQGELAACQRYYFRITAGNGGAGVPLYAWGCAVNATLADFSFPLPVTLRTNASSIDVSNIGVYSILNGTASGGSFTLSYTAANDPQVRYQHGSSLFTSNSMCSIINTTSSAGYISFNAEL